MGPGEVIVAVTAIICSTPVALTVLFMAYNRVKRRDRQQDQSLLMELHELRDEVQRLRQQHQEEVISFDATVNRLDTRVSRLEHHPQLTSGSTGTSVPRITDEEAHVSVRGR